MSETYKLAVVGQGESIAIYAMLGVEPRPVTDAASAQAAIEALMTETQPGTDMPAFAVVFVEEPYHKLLPKELLEKLTKRALPAVLPVPTPQSETGKKSYGVKRLSTIVERAIGSDILG